ncbi:hypothetical protein QBC34DRAFT_469902 [Podospora aff. communis PSN243]|uniref:Uncharacterized protein n=1 Tax=Podospora aff. communis PSN243 TaxID=3040156 RepID=A0AAV9GC86_9PEZI|nr:hypothetical protein QBC34DRAFT_469902 [Podospora aff. communis PSN243]
MNSSLSTVGSAHGRESLRAKMGKAIRRVSGGSDKSASIASDPSPPPLWKQIYHSVTRRGRYASGAVNPLSIADDFAPTLPPLDIDFHLFTKEEVAALFAKWGSTEAEATENNEAGSLVVCKTRTAADTATKGCADRASSGDSTPSFRTACESVASWQTARSELSLPTASLNSLASIEEEPQAPAPFSHRCDYFADASSILEAEPDISLPEYSVHEAQVLDGPKLQLTLFEPDLHQELASPQAASVETEVETDETLDSVRPELRDYCTKLSVIYEETTILSTEMVDDDTRPEAEAELVCSTTTTKNKELSFDDLVSVLAKIYGKTPQVPEATSAPHTSVRAEGDDEAETSSVRSEETHTGDSLLDVTSAKPLDMEDLSSEIDSAEMSFSVGDLDEVLEGYRISPGPDQDDGLPIHADESCSSSVHGTNINDDDALPVTEEHLVASTGYDSEGSDSTPFHEDPESEDPDSEGSEAECGQDVED